MRKRKLLLAAGTCLATLCLTIGLAPDRPGSPKFRHVAVASSGGDASRVRNASLAATPPGLTFIPFAVDVLTYATRGDSTVSRRLSLTQLTAVYNCQNPAFQPLLPAFGDTNRTLLLTRLGITDAPDLVSQPGHTCIKDTDVNGAPILSNDGRLITASNQLVPYSSGPYLSQVNNVNFDKHGVAVLGSINSVSPQVPASAAVTYATRGDSSVPRSLSLAQLAAIYNCTNTTFQPLLPPTGDATRTAFLNAIGVSAPGPCVAEVSLSNDGRVLGNPLQLVPYTVQTYLNQINNVISDIHGAALLGSISAVNPTALNNASVITREVYNVIPTANVGADPWKSVFVGSTSAVCGNTAAIVRQGFNPDANCGATTIHS